MKLTIREYAKQRGVSYESVRKLIARYSEELQDHIITENGVRVLTDEAQEILHNHSKKQVVIYEADETTTIRGLKEELEKEKRKNRNYITEISDLKIQLSEKTEQLSEKNEQIADIKQTVADQTLQIAEKVLEVNNTKYLIEKSQNELDLIATNRQARRKYIKDKKKAEKELKKQEKLKQENNTQ